MYAHYHIHGYRVKKDEVNNNPLSLQNGMMRYDPITKKILIYENGEWSQVKTDVSDDAADGIFQRGMSRMIVPDSESSVNLGHRNETNGFSSIAMGKMAKTNYRGQVSLASGGFIEAGDAQTTRFVMKKDVPPEEETEILIDDVERITLQKKKQMFLSVKFFVCYKPNEGDKKKKGSSQIKRFVYNYKCIAYLNENGEVDGEILDQGTLPEGWSFNQYHEGKALTFYVISPYQSRWVGVVRTIEMDY